MGFHQRLCTWIHLQSVLHSRPLALRKHPLVMTNVAIENCHRKFVDLPSYKMVMSQFAVLVYQRVMHVNAPFNFTVLLLDLCSKRFKRFVSVGNRRKQITSSDSSFKFSSKQVVFLNGVLGFKARPQGDHGDIKAASKTRNLTINKRAIIWGPTSMRLMGPPFDSVQLRYKWLNSMVYDRCNYIVNGVHKPTYNWGAPSCGVHWPATWNPKIWKSFAASGYAENVLNH